MASFDFDQDDRDELEDSFEIEIGQIPGAAPHPAMSFWRARLPGMPPSLIQRRRRYSGVAALVAVACLVLINSVNLSTLLPPGLPHVSSALSGGGNTARAAGYSWFALRQRPLRLPRLAAGASCPVTPLSQQAVQLRKYQGIGDAAIFAVTPSIDANGVQQLRRADFARLANTYRGELVTWYLRLPDEEPVLVRGAQLDGPGIILFDGGIEQQNFEENLLAGRALPRLLISSDPQHGAPVAAWITVTRIASSGCYGYQVDTPTKTMTLVFKAVVEP